MKKTWLVIAGVVMSSAVMAAPLGTNIGGNAEGRGSLDANGQGGMTTQGGQNTDSSDALFGALDGDGSGALNKQEAQAERNLREHFDDIDADSNGEVSREEFLAREERLKEVEEAE